MIALGVETLALAFVHGTDKLGHGYAAIPVLPFLPPMPWLAYIVSAIWIVCGVGLLRAESATNCATILGAMLLVFALFLDAPRAVAHFANISLRTVVFEVVALASLAWMLTASSSPPALFTVGRYLFALSLIVFGVDHYLALAPIAALIPGWIPWPVFWVAFFGAGFIAAGIAIAIGYLARPAVGLDRFDVRDLGRNAALAENLGILRNPRRRARPGRVVEPLHRHRAVGRLLGARRGHGRGRRRAGIEGIFGMAATGGTNARMGRATLASVGIHVLVALAIPALAWTESSAPRVETVSFTHIVRVEIKPPKAVQPPPRAVAPRHSSQGDRQLRAPRPPRLRDAAQTRAARTSDRVGRAGRPGRRRSSANGNRQCRYQRDAECNAFACNTRGCEHRRPPAARRIPSVRCAAARSGAGPGRSQAADCTRNACDADRHRRRRRPHRERYVPTADRSATRNAHSIAARRCELGSRRLRRRRLVRSANHD